MTIHILQQICCSFLKCNHIERIANYLFHILFHLILKCILKISYSVWKLIILYVLYTTLFIIFLSILLTTLAHCSTLMSICSLYSHSCLSWHDVSFLNGRERGMERPMQEAMAMVFWKTQLVQSKYDLLHLNLKFSIKLSHILFSCKLCNFFFHFIMNAMGISNSQSFHFRGGSSPLINLPTWFYHFNFFAFFLGVPSNFETNGLPFSYDNYPLSW